MIVVCLDILLRKRQGLPLRLIVFRCTQQCQGKKSPQGLLERLLGVIVLKIVLVKDQVILNQGFELRFWMAFFIVKLLLASLIAEVIASNTSVICSCFVLVFCIEILEKKKLRGFFSRVQAPPGMSNIVESLQMNL